VLEESRRRAPNHPEPHFLLGSVAELKGDTAAAIGHYEEAVAHGLQDETAYTRLTQLYSLSGLPERAVDAAHRWEEEYPVSHNATLLLGTSYVTMQKYDSAYVTFRRLVARAPDHVLATYYLATACRHLGRLGEARQFAQRAAQLDTAFAWPWLEMIYQAADAGDRAGAAAATREYLRRAPQDSANGYFRKLLQGEL
jgi:tetratricopeptide (TPR) repeat protein